MNGLEVVAAVHDLPSVEYANVFVEPSAPPPATHIEPFHATARTLSAKGPTVVAGVQLIPSVDQASRLPAESPPPTHIVPFHATE